MFGRPTRFPAAAPLFPDGRCDTVTALYAAAEGRAGQSGVGMRRENADNCALPNRQTKGCKP